MTKRNINDSQLSPIPLIWLEDDIINTLQLIISYNKILFITVHSAAAWRVIKIQIAVQDVYYSCLDKVKESPQNAPNP